MKNLIKGELDSGVKQIELAGKIGVSQSTIQKILYTQTKPTIETVKKVARYFNKSTSYFLDDEYPEHVSEELPPFDSGTLKKVPVLNKAQCGKWHDYTDLNYPTGISDRFEYAETKDPHAFFVIAAGDSMIGGDIKERDLLLVEPSKEIHSGNIVLACSTEGKTVKKFQKKDHMIILFPLNEKFDTIILTPQEIEEKRIRFYRITKKMSEL